MTEKERDELLIAMKNEAKERDEVLVSIKNELKDFNYSNYEETKFQFIAYFSFSVYFRDLVVNSDINAKPIPKGFGGLQGKLLLVPDLASDIIGKPAVSV